MKLFLTVIVLSGAAVLLSQCKTQKETAYIVPPQYTGETRQNLINMLEHGQKLYKIHCTRCHGIFKKSKDSIPDFSKTQIENYELAALREDQTNHAMMEKIRPYDLDMIMQFLTFRRVYKKE